MQLTTNRNRVIFGGEGNGVRSADGLQSTVRHDRVRANKDLVDVRHNRKDGRICDNGRLDTALCQTQCQFVTLSDEQNDNKFSSYYTIQSKFCSFRQKGYKDNYNTYRDN